MHKLERADESEKLDKTYVRIKGQWKYLYKVMDTEGNTLDFYLSNHWGGLMGVSICRIYEIIRDFMNV